MEPQHSLGRWGAPGNFRKVSTGTLNGTLGALFEGLVTQNCEKNFEFSAILAWNDRKHHSALFEAASESKVTTSTCAGTCVVSHGPSKCSAQLGSIHILMIMSKNLHDIDQQSLLPPHMGKGRTSALAFENPNSWKLPPSK